MKILLLHKLEKKIRHFLRSSVIKSKSFFYKKKFNKITDNKKFDNYVAQFENNPNPKVSIVISVFNKFKFTQKCLNSIHYNTNDVSYEIIIIDDCSTDNTTCIPEKYPNIIYLRNEKNIGYTKSINKGVALAKGEFIYLINNDTITTKNYLSSLINVFKNKDIGIVGSMLIYPNGLLQEAGGYITNNFDFGNRGNRKSIFDHQYNYLMDTSYVSGASLLIKKYIWVECNGFDENYSPAYFEDTDLCTNVLKKGYRVIYQPQSKIIHYESVSYGKNITDQKSIQMIKNKRIFIDKWSDKFPIINNHKTILICDFGIPDIYDCGSKVLINLLTTFKLKGFNVKFFPMNVNWTDLKNIQKLELLGIEVLYKVNLYGSEISYHKKDIKILTEWFNENYIDYFLFNRPESINMMNLISKILKKKISYFYHPADLHFLRNQRKNVILNKTNNDINKDEIHLIQNALYVLHVSLFEKNYLLEKFNINNGVIIPCLLFNDENSDILCSTDELMYVGSAHEASVDGIEWFINHILPNIIIQFPKIKIHIVGDCGKSINSTNNIIVHGRVSEDKLKQLYRKYIPIIPLRYGAGVKGKTLEAMAYSRTFISTSIGLEGIIGLDSKIKGFDTVEEFTKAIINVLKNNINLNQQRDISREIIRKFYSQSYLEEQLEKLF